MILYHTSFSEIKNPDIHYGRKNADFAQGFYLTPDKEFAMRWAKEKPDAKTYINVYELDESQLKVKTLERNEEWFEYIFNNRAGKEDSLAEFDVIVGPIANDTIHDVFGITTSGFLTKEQSVLLLQLGPVYTQLTIKTSKAADALRWIESSVIDHDSLIMLKKEIQPDVDEYMNQFQRKLNELLGD